MDNYNSSLCPVAILCSRRSRLRMCSHRHNAWWLRRRRLHFRITSPSLTRWQMSSKRRVRISSSTSSLIKSMNIPVDDGADRQS